MKNVSLTLATAFVFVLVLSAPIRLSLPLGGLEASFRSVYGQGRQPLPSTPPRAMAAGEAGPGQKRQSRLDRERLRGAGGRPRWPEVVDLLLRRATQMLIAVWLVARALCAPAPERRVAR